MVKLLYAGEHLSCPNYDAGRPPLIEEVAIPCGNIWQVQAQANKLVFVLDGQIEYSTGQVYRYPARKGDIFFLPAGHQLWCYALEESTLLEIRLLKKIRFCDCFSVEDLFRMKGEMENAEEKPFLLKVNIVMEKYLDLLVTCYGAGLRCRYYNEERVRELMYIFLAFYPKEDLHRFFAPVLTADFNFLQQVMAGYSRYDNLSQIAFAMNYSVSGFEKKFRKAFGCSPSGWIARQKAQEAWHCVHSSDMNFKEIADRFGFSSPSSFSNFFKKHFGVTPGMARQNKRKRRE